MSIARLGNKYLQDTAPWHAIKEENGEQRVREIFECFSTIVGTIFQNL